MTDQYQPWEKLAEEHELKKVTDLEKENEQLRDRIKTLEELVEKKNGVKHPAWYKKVLPQVGANKKKKR